MNRTLSEHQVDGRGSSPAGRSFETLVAQESLIMEATELVCEHLERAGVSRAELARRLGKTRGHVTQLLSGERNLTLRTLADIGTALGITFEIRTKP